MTPTQPTHTTTEVSEAMVDAYKHAFGDYFAKVTAGLVFPPTADIGRHATKYAIEAALYPRDGVPGLVLVPNGDPVTFDDCPEGLFLCGQTLAVMTEYATDRSDIRQRDAYIVDSGEYFWGGTSYAKDRAKLMVQPLSTASSSGRETP